MPQEFQIQSHLWYGFMISSLGAKIRKKVKKQNKDTFFNAYSLDAKKTYPQEKGQVFIAIYFSFKVL